MAGKAVRQSQQPSSGLDTWAQSLPDAYIQCRDFGHSWRPFRAWLTGEHTYSRTLRCQRCATERAQELSVSGHTLSSHYVYADGYTAPKGTGRLDAGDRDVLRLASTLRLIDERQPNAGNSGNNNVRPLRAGRKATPRKTAPARAGRKAAAKR